MECIKLYAILVISVLAHFTYGQDQNETQTVEQGDNEITKDNGFPPYNYTEPDSTNDLQNVDYDLDAQGVNETAETPTAQPPAVSGNPPTLAKESLLKDENNSRTGPLNRFTNIHLKVPSNLVENAKVMAALNVVGLLAMVYAVFDLGRKYFTL